MASNYLGINRGAKDNPGGVTIGTTSTGADIEIRIDTGKSTTKKDVIKAMMVFEQYIMSSGKPWGASGTDLPPN